MATEATAYSRDREIRLIMKAYKKNYWVYKSIGTEVQVQRRALRRKVLGIIGPKVLRWQGYSASTILIQNSFRGSEPGAEGNRKCYNHNRQSLTCGVWKGSVSLTWDAEAATGYPETYPTPSAAPVSFRIQSVWGTGLVTIGGEQIGVGPVEISF